MMLGRSPVLSFLLSVMSFRPKSQLLTKSWANLSEASLFPGVGPKPLSCLFLPASRHQGLLHLPLRLQHVCGLDSGSQLPMCGAGSLRSPCSARWSHGMYFSTPHLGDVCALSLGPCSLEWLLEQVQSDDWYSSLL
jgi:hypothetical protein